MGGNVFDNCVPFDQAFTADLTQQLDQVLHKLHVNAIPIGSTANPVSGQTSGDLDVIVEQNILGRQFNTRNTRTIRKKMKSAFEQAGYDTDQSGVSVHVNLPLNRRYHQADIMVVEDAANVSKFHIHNIPKGSPYKGINKHLALMYLAKQQNLLWSAFSGLYRRDQNGKRSDLITRDIDRIAYILLGVNATAKDIANFENIQSAMSSQQAQEMLNTLRQDANWKEHKTS
jgi:hypothetical protein